MCGCVDVWMYVCMYVCMLCVCCVYGPVCVYVYVYGHVYVYMCVCVCVCVCIPLTLSFRCEGGYLEFGDHGHGDG